MTLREILIGDINLYQNTETGKYSVRKSGHKAYTLKDGSSTELAIRILDTRLLAQERRIAYEKANSEDLCKKLEKICNSKIYKFLHYAGLI